MNQFAVVRSQLEGLPKEQYWNISPEVGQFFANLITQLDLKRVLEVGTSNGYSALWFAEGLAQTNGHLWTVESNEQRFGEATSNFVQAQTNDLITQIKGHAPEVISRPDTPDQLDLVFLDATKCEYKDHLQAVLPLLSSSGCILADNVQSHLDTMQPFFDAINELPHYQVFFEPELGTGLIAIIPADRAGNIFPLLKRLSGYNWADQAS